MLEALLIITVCTITSSEGVAFHEDGSAWLIPSRVIIKESRCIHDLRNGNMACTDDQACQANDWISLETTKREIGLYSR